jgi:hypothetical protein
MDDPVHTLLDCFHKLAYLRVGSLGGRRYYSGNIFREPVILGSFT